MTITTQPPREEMTTDVCETPFPPAIYGRELDEVERTIAEVIERIFRDEDGMIRSGVYGKTMQALKADEVEDRPHGIGTFVENAAMPRELKPVWLNYENAGQASGKYLRALLQKHAATRDPATLALARRTFAAIQLLWKNAAEQNPYGRGWIPKPYAGIRSVAEMFECSVDQYADITLALESFHHQAATADEKLAIKEMVASFADWWIERNYTAGYMGQTCYWRQLGRAHAIGFFLYLHALAYSWYPQKKYKEGFDLWLDSSRALVFPYACVNGYGLAVECMERLLKLRPDLKGFWLEASETNVEHMLRLSEQPYNYPKSKIRMQLKAFVAHHLGAAHRLLPAKGYDARMRELLAAYNKRADFYHLSRGLRLDELDERVTGNDYRNCFFAEGHICWLDAYWTMKERQG
ncbi:MAG: hypothetical protein HY360_10385 [Verrucomicrobia bacterium]|nr:hypothetical protein [Verrucomicrobiota bacterium]